jgi:serine/threonine-protein kinase
MKVHLHVTAGPDRGRTFSFDARDRFVIGRAPTANFQICEDIGFSRHHVMLEVNPPNVMIQDLKSTNGTYLNGQKLTGPTSMSHGDTIGGGSTCIQLEIDDEMDAGFDDTVHGMGVQAGSKNADPKLLTVAETDHEVAGKLAVRCLRCGIEATNENPRSQAENMAYFCDPCQVDILKEPQLVPGYQVVKEIGRGGMGAVYLALHPVLGRRAIKVILPRAAMSERLRDMFFREASSQAKLNHPNVVQVHDFQETEPGIYCMVMEYHEGTNAERMIAHSPNGIDVQLAIDIVVQALDGLAHAHAHGVVHRDIKGANLLVGRDEARGPAVKLSDFGLAKSYETSGAGGLTNTGDWSGTLPFVSPEQVLDFRNVRPQSDLYSMGATLYHLLTGKFAYNFRPEVAPLVSILEEPIVPLRTRRPLIPAGVAEVIEIAMRKEPGDRFANARAMRTALLAARG